MVYYQKELKTIFIIIVKRLESGSPFKVGSIELGELKERVSRVKEELNELNEKVSSLFLATMAPQMFFNLDKLSSGCFGKYEMSDALERELYHLRDIGYIEVFSIHAIPKKGDDLSQHVNITHAGAKFVELRKKYY